MRHPRLGRDSAAHSDAPERRTERHRAAPNRALSQLISATKTSVPPAQRYTVVPASDDWRGTGVDMKVSDDGAMAVKHVGLYPKGEGRRYQDFYATGAVFEAAVRNLAELRSIYRISRGAELPKQTAVEPTLYAVQVENRELDVEGAGAATPLNCDDNTRSFLGMEHLSPGDMERTQIAARIKAKRFVSNATESPMRTDPEDPLAIEMDEAKTENVEIRPPYRDWADPMKVAAVEALTGETGATGRAAYARMPESVKSSRAQEAINSCAVAGLGGAYGVWGSSGRHFAPVLATSGHDEVTLEAHVQDQTTKGPAKDEIHPGDKDSFNPEWYFQMYGPANKVSDRGVEDQTFYGRHRSRYPDDLDLMVVAFRKLPAPRTAEDLAQRRRSFGPLLVAKARRTADTTAQELNVASLGNVQGQISNALDILRRDVAWLPADAAGYPNWFLRWAAEIDEMAKAVDAASEIHPNVRVKIWKVLMSVSRALRRAETSMH